MPLYLYCTLTSYVLALLNGYDEGSPIFSQGSRPSLAPDPAVLWIGTVAQFLHSASTYEKYLTAQCYSYCAHTVLRCALHHGKAPTETRYHFSSLHVNSPDILTSDTDRSCIINPGNLWNSDTIISTHIPTFRQRKQPRARRATPILNSNMVSKPPPNLRSRIAKLGPWSVA